MRRFRIRLARSGDSHALADLRDPFWDQPGISHRNQVAVSTQMYIVDEKAFSCPSLSPWRCWVCGTMANSYSATFARSCLRKSPILLKTNRSFMLMSQTFMSSRKCGAMDLEKDCWRKRYHGAAPGGPMRSFCGRLPKADLFIAAAVWLSLRIFSSCDTVRFYRARAARQNCSRPVLAGRIATMETRYK